MAWYYFKAILIFIIQKVCKQAEFYNTDSALEIHKHSFSI